MLKFAPFMTLLDLAAAALMYVQFRRMMADKEMGYLIAKIEPAISGGSCALGIMHNFLVHIDPPAKLGFSCHLRLVNLIRTEVGTVLHRHLRKELRQ
ncbi:MAG: hypothetical protein ACXU87_00205 [Xanthobacteraceae bacterium]